MRRPTPACTTKTDGALAAVSRIQAANREHRICPHYAAAAIARITRFGRLCLDGRLTPAQALRLVQETEASAFFYPPIRGGLR